jgi:hypothetical protein
MLSEETLLRFGVLAMRQYAAFLQNAGIYEPNTQSVALGWYAVSLWDII